MESIIERITRGDLWSFHGGITPPEQKELTSHKPIKSLALPKQLIIPLQQHIGREGSLLVNVGDKVLKGQPLTASENPMAVPIHASTSGTVTAIKKSVIAHPSALNELCIFIEVDGEDKWVTREQCSDLNRLSQLDIVKKIANAGIVGMGGAGFPTHIKVNSKSDIEFLIINGAECEPYITADDLLMQEESSKIISGIKVLERLLTPKTTLIAIEDNKPKAIKALQNATASFDNIIVCALPTKYPTGGEKQLIKILTGKEIKSGSLPIHSGIVMQNIATCFAISEAIYDGTPLLQRVITVTGQALSQPQNVWALLGTPVDFLLKACGAQPQKASNKENKQAVIMGGPMMGFSLSSDFVPVIKTSNCLLVPSKKEMPSAFADTSAEVECIRCGQCADVCPSQLLPQELQWSAKAKDYPQLAKLNLSDCIDCGACAYVCPSQIPLVQYYRVAKAEIRNQQQLDLKSEKAKVRFEARKLRLEKEKIAREEKHKKAAAARKASMNKNTPEAAGAKSAVAAALARVKAKKARSKSTTEESTNTSTSITDEKSQVKSAIARAKAKKLAKMKDNQESSSSSDDKSKLTSTLAENTESSKTVDNQIENQALTQGIAQNIAEEATLVDNKKAKIAAAIAKAKAKKSEKTEQTTPDVIEVITTNKDDKKAKITAAIAKAKAKKLASEDQETIKISDNKQSPEDNKKIKLAAAIAKAKAKASTKIKNDNKKESKPSNKPHHEST